MNIKKLLALIVSMALALTAIAGCSSAPQQAVATHPPAAQGTADTTTPDTDGVQVNWPEGTVTYLISAAAGGSTDLNARAIMSTWKDYYKESLVFENISGGGGVAAMVQLADAEPDGLTLGSLAVGSLLVKAWQQDMEVTKDEFSYICGLLQTSYYMVVMADFPANTIEEYVELIKSNPGKYTYGQGSVGGISHLATMIMLDHYGITNDTTMIAYDSGNESFLAMLGNHVDMCVMALSSIAQYIDDGTIKVLAYSGSERSLDYPDVPCFGELNMTPVESRTVVCGPLNMDPAMVNVIAEYYRNALEGETVRKALAEMNLTNSISYKGPEEITAYCNELYEGAGAVLTTLGYAK